MNKVSQLWQNIFLQMSIRHALSPSPVVKEKEGKRKGKKIDRKRKTCDARIKIEYYNSIFKVSKERGREKD